MSEPAIVIIVTWGMCGREVDLSCGFGSMNYMHRADSEKTVNSFRVH